MAATIKDVARLANVSVATVSRLVNKTGNVRAEAAERIQNAIAELGFRPNAVGRSLKTARTKALGVVTPSISNPVFAETVAGVSEQARALGYNLMLTVTDYDLDGEETAVGALMGYQVDGLIATVADPETSPSLDMLEAASVPYTLVYNQPCARRRPTITVDNVAAGRDVARAFAAAGHCRFGMIAGSFKASDRSRARQTGFTQELEEAGFQPPTVREVDFVDGDVDEVVADLFQAVGDAPTALFCSNDLLAISVIGALRRRGLRVPEDASVIGFDGISAGTHLSPTLATVVQPSREMGRVAAQQLLGHLSGHAPPETVLLPHHLRLGESAGQAPKPVPADNQDSSQPVQKRKTAP